MSSLCTVFKFLSLIKVYEMEVIFKHPKEVSEVNA